MRTASRAGPIPLLLALLLGAVGCGDTSGPTDAEDPSADGPGHNAGAVCGTCHEAFAIGGTVWTDSAAVSPAAGVSVVLTGPTGNEVVPPATDGAGNLHSTLVPAGRYRLRVGARTSRTWHAIPDQGSCNRCHQRGGGATSGGALTFPDLHTAVPADNDCTHCHHFPAPMTLSELRSPGPLNASAEAPEAPESQVRFGGRIYPFDPPPGGIATTRPDIFATGFFSMFDAILAVAAREGIDIEYHFDEDRQSHFIESVDGVTGDYWYHFSYDAGSGSERELGYRRAYRWDEALWRPGVWVELVEGENLAEIRAEYLEEIQRERAHGRVIPEVTIAVNPSSYQGNPEGSHRMRVQRSYADVPVTPHGLRSTGYPTPYSKPFRPDVTTTLDILLSLQDRGDLDLVTAAFYDRFGGHYIDSYYVVALGFPGTGVVHASGRHGFVYTTGNGTPQRLPNDADGKFHMTADISVVHAPDFTYWHWIELGNPFYEGDASRAPDLHSSVLEDYEGLSRGFSLHAPVRRGGGRIDVSYAVFDPGEVLLTVRAERGEVVATLVDRFEQTAGIRTLSWLRPAENEAVLHLTLDRGHSRQIRALH